MCAAGCLISNDEYSVGMENLSWTAAIFPEAHRHMIIFLQIIHDRHNVNRWPESLINLAENYGLDTNFMLTLK